MYYQIGKTFVGDPVLEITYEAAEELTKDEYERREEALPGEKVLREAKKLINPNFKATYNRWRWIDFESFGICCRKAQNSKT